MNEATLRGPNSEHEPHGQPYEAAHTFRVFDGPVPIIVNRVSRIFGNKLAEIHQAVNPELADQPLEASILRIGDNPKQAAVTAENLSTLLTLLEQQNIAVAEELIEGSIDEFRVEIRTADTNQPLATLRLKYGGVPV